MLFRSARFSEPRAIALIRHGSVIRKNLQQEMLTDAELDSQLRQSGVDDIGDVKHAWLEPDGHVSVIRYSEHQSNRRKTGMPGAG